MNLIERRLAEQTSPWDENDPLGTPICIDGSPLTPPAVVPDQINGTIEFTSVTFLASDESVIFSAANGTSADITTTISILDASGGDTTGFQMGLSYDGDRSVAK